MPPFPLAQRRPGRRHADPQPAAVAQRPVAGNVAGAARRAGRDRRRRDGPRRHHRRRRTRLLRRARPQGMRANNYDPAYVDALFALCAEVMQAIVRLPKPVIARVHGVATAAGRNSSPAPTSPSPPRTRASPRRASISACSARRPWWRCRAMSRTKHAMQMLLSGDLIDAATALRFGLVNELAPPANWRRGPSTLH